MTVISFPRVKYNQYPYGTLRGVFEIYTVAYILFTMVNQWNNNVARDHDRRDFWTNVIISLFIQKYTYQFIDWSNKNSILSISSFPHKSAIHKYYIGMYIQFTLLLVTNVKNFFRLNHNNKSSKIFKAIFFFCLCTSSINTFVIHLFRDKNNLTMRCLSFNNVGQCSEYNNTKWIHFPKT